MTRPPVPWHQAEVSNLACFCALVLFLGMVMIWVRVLT